ERPHRGTPHGTDTLTGDRRGPLSRWLFVLSRSARCPAQPVRYPADGSATAGGANQSPDSALSRARRGLASAERNGGRVLIKPKYGMGLPELTPIKNASRSWRFL